MELEASGPKSVVSGGEVANRDAPRLVVASLHIKTHFNHSSQANEVVSAGVVYLNNAKVSVSLLEPLLGFPPLLVYGQGRTGWSLRLDSNRSLGGGGGFW